MQVPEFKSSTTKKNFKWATGVCTSKVDCILTMCKALRLTHSTISIPPKSRRISIHSSPKKTYKLPSPSRRGQAQDRPCVGGARTCWQRAMGLESSCISGLRTPQPHSLHPRGPPCLQITQGSGKLRAEQGLGRELPAGIKAPGVINNPGWAESLPWQVQVSGKSQGCQEGFVYKIK